LSVLGRNNFYYKNYKYNKNIEKYLNNKYYFCNVMSKVNIALKDSVHKKAKVIAVLKNLRLADYLEKAIEDAVKKDSAIIKKLGEK